VGTASHSLAARGYYRTESDIYYALPYHKVGISQKRPYEETKQEDKARAGREAGGEGIFPGAFRVPTQSSYFLDSAHAWPAPDSGIAVGEDSKNWTSSLYCKSGECWSLVNEIEQAWTGVEESDYTFISQLVHGTHGSLITVCLLRCTIPEN
jgi:hypothetical protein